MCRDLELSVNTTNYTRAQITAVKFFMNSVHTPANDLYSCMMVLFLTISIPFSINPTPQYHAFSSPTRGGIWGFVQLTNLLQGCTFKLMMPGSSESTALREVREKIC